MGITLRWRRARRLDAVTVCETCGEVCDARCRADTLRHRARATAMTFQAGRR
jgi:hypothetical protein